MLFNNKKCLVFDFDGTIADTYFIHEQAFQEALSTQSLKFDYADYLGRSTQEAIKEIFIDNGQDVDDSLLKLLTKEKQRIANGLYESSLKFIDTAEEFIKEAYAKGFKLGVASSGSRKNVTTGIKMLGLESYFKSVVTADDVKLSKPNPEIFLCALERLNNKPSQSLVIEDAISGIQAASAAGIDVVCVDKTINCDLVEGKINVYNFSFQELVKILADEPEL